MQATTHTINDKATALCAEGLMNTIDEFTEAVAGDPAALCFLATIRSKVAEAAAVMARVTQP